MGQGSLTLFLVFVSGLAHAVLVEETMRVPVEVRGTNGKRVQHDVIVTIFREEARVSSPFVIINHGRAGNAEGRNAVKRWRYPEISRYLVQRGYAVFVPTRIGYGDTGGEDVEHPIGGCAHMEHRG